MKPNINARMEHVTRKADRRKPETPEPDVLQELGTLVNEMNRRRATGGEVGRLTVPGCLQLTMGTPHAETLAQALEHQLYRLEAEEKAMLAFPIRRPYLLNAIRAEIHRSHDLLNVARSHLKTEAAGPPQAAAENP